MFWIVFVVGLFGLLMYELATRGSVGGVLPTTPTLVLQVSEADKELQNGQMQATARNQWFFFLTTATPKPPATEVVVPSVTPVPFEFSGSSLQDATAWALQNSQPTPFPWECKPENGDPCMMAWLKAGKSPTQWWQLWTPQPATVAPSLTPTMTPTVWYNTVVPRFEETQEPTIEVRVRVGVGCPQGVFYPVMCREG